MKLEVPGATIDYETEGPRNGVPVVFVHGFPFSRAMWRAEALKADHFVVTYDVRGHGASDAGDGQYTVELFVDDLVALLDRLHLKTAVGVGLSMGGYILLRAVERHPERFRGLVLCDTRSEADGNEGKVKRARQAADIRQKGLGSFTEGFLKAVFAGTTLEEKRGVVESIRAVINGTDPRAVAGTLIALAGRTDSAPSLFRIAVPSLVLVGRDDAVTPPSAAQAMKDKIPGAELRVIPRAGHLSNLENPEEFNRHLTEFLRTFKRPSS
jgi:pimeloyl-ACP methyl ester carboxylesterase